METITMLLTMCIALMLLHLYLLKRNTRVYTFRTSVLEDVDSKIRKRIEQNAITREEIFQIYGILDDVSYAKMLYSFKPLKVEFWYTEEELKIMGYESK